MRILAAALVLAGVIAPIAPAHAQIAPIVIREAKDHPGCRIYLKADGSRLLFKQKPIAAGGNCPPDFLRGSVTRFGPSTYRLRAQGGVDCVMTPAGFGRCS